MPMPSVHRLYEGEAVGPIEAAFPGVTRGGKVDRKLLAEQLAGSPGALKQLEAIVHPMVVAAEIDFLIEQEKTRARSSPCSRSRFCSRPAPSPRRRDDRAQRASRMCRGSACWRGPA